MGVLVGDVKIIQQKMANFRQAGWKCEACNVHNMAYSDPAVEPIIKNCINCGSLELKKEWDHILKTIETTETIPVG